MIDLVWGITSTSKALKMPRAKQKMFSKIIRVAKHDQFPFCFHLVLFCLFFPSLSFPSFNLPPLFLLYPQQSPLCIPYHMQYPSIVKEYCIHVRHPSKLTSARVVLKCIKHSSCVEFHSTNQNHMCQSRVSCQHILYIMYETVWRQVLLKMTFKRNLFHKRAS